MASCLFIYFLHQLARWILISFHFLFKHFQFFDGQLALARWILINFHFLLKHFQFFDGQLALARLILINFHFLSKHFIYFLHQLTHLILTSFRALFKHFQFFDDQPSSSGHLCAIILCFYPTSAFTTQGHHLVHHLCSKALFILF